MVDLMALIRILQAIPETYEEVSKRLFEMLPLGYSNIDIVADAYQEVSSKDSERKKRGVSEKVVIRSAQSKIPRNFSHFLKNGDNKTRLIEIIKEYLVDNKQEVLNRLDCNEIFFSVDRLCYKVTDTDVNLVDCLSSNQEDEDTKLLLHAFLYGKMVEVLVVSFRV